MSFVAEPGILHPVRSSAFITGVLVARMIHVLTGARSTLTVSMYA